MTINIIAATEDAVSEAIIKKILSSVEGYVCTTYIGRRGNTYLRQRVRNFNRTSAGCPVLLLTDQDSYDCCPPSKIRQWLGSDVEKHPYFLFRVAVMESESWLLADRDNVSDFLRVPINRIPNNCDSIENPKQFLVNVARRSQLRHIRSEIVPRNGTTAQVGPNYNPLITNFIQERWDPMSASTHSYSLLRTIRRLTDFREEFPRG